MMRAYIATQAAATFLCTAIGIRRRLSSRAMRRHLPNLSTASRPHACNSRNLLSFRHENRTLKEEAGGGEDEARVGDGDGRPPEPSCPGRLGAHAIGDRD